MFDVEATSGALPKVKHQYALTVQLGLSPAGLGRGTAGTTYHRQLTSTGGTAPYAFTVTSGSLPPGLELTPDGELVGLAEEAGESHFSVTVVDSSEPLLSRTREYRLPIRLGFTPMSLPKGEVGSSYDQQIFVLGSSFAPFAWGVAGELPPGLEVSPFSYGRLVISGTPEREGIFPLLISANDSAGLANSGARRYTIRVNAPTVKPGLPLGRVAAGGARRPSCTHADA